jgi:enamine deaminase RidA (YjgF/YER057c/UK114 family)
VAPIRTFTSGRPWEAKYSHSRGILYGDIFETCLTSPSNPDGSIVGAGDIFTQTVRCYEIVLASLKEASLTPARIVRSDVYMLDTRQWEAAARAHRHVIGDEARPVLSFIGCANFWDPDILVEVAIRAYAGA